MRVAVLSDIHGFSLAFERVLRDLDATGPYDEIVVAGDLCEVGPAPEDVLDLLRARSFTVLQGNTDAEIVEGARTHIASAADAYAISKIGDAGVAYLAALPFSTRITPPGGSSPADDLLVIHANPQNLEHRFHPGMSDRELREIKGDTVAGAIAFGHVHICYIRQLDETLLVDVSAVGNPKDGDLRCKYGILTWSEAAHRWSAELRKLDYPLTETEDQILASDLPDREKVLKKLKRASYA
jgi:predicted phosphodiesterase